MMPSGWTVASLDELADKIGDGLHGTPNYDESGEFYFINGNNIKNGNIIVDSSTKRISKDEFKKLDKKLNGNSLLLSINGTVGNLAYYKNEKIALGKSAAYITLKDNISREFIFYCLSGNSVQSYFTNELTGSTIKNLSLKTIRNTKVPIPPKNEQEKIAKIISTWDEAIERIDSFLKARLKIKSYYVSSMLNPHQNGWKTYRLSDLGEISKGKGIAKSDITEIGIPCIRYGEIYTTHHTVIRCFNSHISKETAKESKRLNKDDIVFAGSGETAEEIGKSVAYLKDEEAYVGGDTIILSPSSHSSLFLSYVFNSSYTRRQLNVLGQGNAVVHLYPKALAEVTVALPEVAQQIKIASCLNSLDEEILVYKQLIEKFKTQKQGLMQQLLSGKKRVKV